MNWVRKVCVNWYFLGNRSLSVAVFIFMIMILFKGMIVSASEIRPAVSGTDSSDIPAGSFYLSI